MTSHPRHQVLDRRLLLERRQLHIGKGDETAEHLSREHVESEVDETESEGDASGGTPPASGCLFADGLRILKEEVAAVSFKFLRMIDLSCQLHGQLNYM